MRSLYVLKFCGANRECLNGRGARGWLMCCDVSRGLFAPEVFPQVFGGVNELLLL
jgi:hypothetical protein